MPTSFIRFVVILEEQARGAVLHFADCEHILLPCFSGSVPYRPLRVRRQLGLVQGIVVLDAVEERLLAYADDQDDTVDELRRRWMGIVRSEAPFSADPGCTEQYPEWWAMLGFQRAVVGGSTSASSADTEVTDTAADYWRRRYREEEQQTRGLRDQVTELAASRGYWRDQYTQLHTILSGSSEGAAQARQRVRLYRLYAVALEQLDQVQSVLHHRLRRVHISDMFYLPDGTRPGSGPGESSADGPADSD